ncbi:MAG: DMT family transporter [Candidatus Woesearchaeota archaeon]|nr:MAG: DMT family transporter [Candidatus Woesearchaeota archaeon]
MKIGLIAVIIAALLYGGFTVLIKHGMNNGLNPISLTTSLSIPLIIFSLIYIIYKKEEVKIIDKIYWVYLLIIAFIATFLGRTLHVVGTFYTSAINAGFILKLVALTTPIFAFLILREKLKRKDYFAIIIAIISAFLVSTGGKLTQINIGDIPLVILAILVGFSNTLAKKTMKKINPYIISSFRLIIGGILLLIIVPLFLGKETFSAMNSLGIWYVLIGGVFGIGFTFLLYKGMESLGASKAVAIFLLSSVFTTIFAYIFLEERLTLIKGIGATGILIGAYIIHKEEKITTI